MGLEMTDRLDVMLQHKLLLFVRSTVALSLTVAVEDLPPVSRAQGEDCMQNSWFVKAHLEEQGVPEGQDKNAWYLFRGTALEPLKVSLLFHACSKDGDTRRWSESDAVVL